MFMRIIPLLFGSTLSVTGSGGFKPYAHATSVEPRTAVAEATATTALLASRRVLGGAPLIRRRKAADGTVLVVDRSAGTFTIGNTAPIPLPAQILLGIAKVFRAADFADALEQEIKNDPGYAKHLVAKFAHDDGSRLRISIGSNPSAATPRVALAAWTASGNSTVAGAVRRFRAAPSPRRAPSRPGNLSAVKLVSRGWDQCADISLQIMAVTLDRNNANISYLDLLTGAAAEFGANGEVDPIGFAAAIAFAYDMYGIEVLYDTQELNVLATLWNVNDCWTWQYTPKTITDAGGDFGGGGMEECSTDWAEVDYVDANGDSSVLWSGWVDDCNLAY